MPVGLAEAFFGTMALEMDQDGPLIGDASEPLGVELFLPRGTYRVGVGPGEFSRLDESFSVGSGLESKTLHAKDDGNRVELHFAGSTTEALVLISRVDATVDAGENGHLVEVDSTQFAYLYLAPGRYRAVDADGRSAEFDVSDGVSSVTLELQ